MVRAYVLTAPPHRHRRSRERWRHPLGDLDVLCLSVTAVLVTVAVGRVGVWRACLVGAAAWGTAAWISRTGRRLLLGGLLTLAVGAQADHQLRSAAPRQLGDFAGWATVVGDPSPVGRGVRITLEIHGERFDAWVYGGSRRKVLERQAGQLLAVVGVRRPLGAHPTRSLSRHVVGRFDVEFVGDWLPGSRLAVANSRLRDALRRSAERVLPDAEAALFTGLVIGDDVRQPAAMVQSFRDAGLSHLTAVSGQNVAYVLAAGAPLLRRLRAGPRWVCTLSLILWFMALTRFEPSVLRAGVMAMMSATGFVLGRVQRAPRQLCLAVIGLVLIDPLLVWSVGFWLSVGATGGVVVVGPWLQQHLPGPSWWSTAVGVTLGAQLGVALPSLLVFGRLPLVSLPANLLAVPVGGFVMLYGLPAGLVAAIVPPLAPVVMFPAVVGTRWVATVAALAPRFEPPETLMLPGWGLIGVVTLAAAWRSRNSRGDVPF